MMAAMPLNAGLPLGGDRPTGRATDAVCNGAWQTTGAAGSKRGTGKGEQMTTTYGDSLTAERALLIYGFPRAVGER